MGQRLHVNNWRALALSGYRQESDGKDYIAARAGALNPQTSWVLERLDLKPPMLLTDASARFSSVVRRMDTTYPDSPLREAWSIASRTGGVAPIINDDGTPYGLINGLTIFSFLDRNSATAAANVDLPDPGAPAIRTPWDPDRILFSISLCSL